MSFLKGMFVEYAISLPPLILLFDFNPREISRSRTVNITTGSTPATRGGYDFELPTETARVSQGVGVEPETFSIEILIDATDRMNQDHPIATTLGIEPELDTLRSMIEPKAQGPGGLQMLAGLGFGGARAFDHSISVSVILFIWGSHILPVFLKSINVREEAHLPTLIPYRATVTISMQVIESSNPFYNVEKVRQLVGSGINSGQTLASSIGGIL